MLTKENVGNSRVTLILTTSGENNIGFAGTISVNDEPPVSFSSIDQVFSMIELFVDVMEQIKEEGAEPVVQSKPMSAFIKE